MRGFEVRRVLALGVTFVLSAAAVGSAGERSIVTLAGDRLTVVARAERAAAVIAEVERATGVRIELPESAAHRTLTVVVHDLPVEKAVRVVLQRLAVINLAVIYGSDSIRFIAFPTPPAAPEPVLLEAVEEEVEEAPVGETYEGLETAGTETGHPMRLAAVHD